MMNAQAQWKELYRKAQMAKILKRNTEAWECLFSAMRYRREAALERKLAAAQRTIEAQQQAAIKFSKQHYYGAECDPQVDPQDWHDFDVVFGI